MKKALALSLMLLLVLSLSAGAAEPIRIGVLAPHTGFSAVFGTYLNEGFIMAMEEANYTIAGRPVEAFFEDSGGNAEQVVTRLTALKERDNVHVVIGANTGTEGLAAVDWASRNSDMPIVVVYSAPEDITMRLRQPNVVRAGWTGAQPMFALGEYAAVDLGYKRMVIIAQDYSFPYNQVGGFVKGFFLNGGQEVVRIWHPVDTDDFSSIFARLPRDVDAALVVSGGADVIPFIRQWFDFGMDQDLPLLASSNVADTTVLNELGDDVIGLISSMHYAEGLQDENFVNWKNAYVKRFGRIPAAVSEHAYVATKMVIQAVEALDGNIEDYNALLEIIKQIEMPDAPRGPIAMDEYGNPTQNIYIRKVQRVNGELVNVPFRVIEAVSQFGPFEKYPELYMSFPPDSRDFPPATLEEFKAIFPMFFE